ncbi:DEAD/DEAH box helicase, partial [Candidatus Gracilibacteria bacterium]|nr:DEAD/DEAH box helicase [Candidatus Gracilibacteria bacterium]
MFPTLAIQLEKNHSYTNSGNFFSKSLLIKENLEEHKKIVLVVENEKLVNQYKKVFEYIRVNYQEVDNYSSLTNVLKNNSGLFLVTNYSLKEEIITPEQLLYFSQELKVGESYEINTVIKKLAEIGFEYSDFSNHGTYKKSGDILSVIDFNGEHEYKISFWGESVEEILQIKKIKEDIIASDEVKEIHIGGNQKLYNQLDKNTSTIKTSDLQHFLKISNAFIVLDSLDFSEYYDENISLLDNICTFDFVTNKLLKTKNLEIDTPNIDKIDTLKNVLSDNKQSVEIYSKNTNTINNFLEYNSLPQLFIHEISGNFLKSFEVISQKKIVLCDDILGKIFIKKRLSKNVAADLDLLLKITPGDYVVHIDHGIGIFKGIIKKELPTSNSKKILIKEYIEIHYKGEDKLFVPITEVSRVNKFIGGDNPKLTGLNTSEWSRKLKKVDEEVAIIAEELLEVYSQRKMGSSFAFVPDIQKELSFQSSFPYTYTPDQDEAIDEILGDMSKQEPMDRLLVGDVGFGKTEVAFNAIHRAFINKKQSVFIAPLVVLAYEHYEKALERFRSLGMNIAVVTRMESAKKIDAVLKGLNDGEIDLVVGTHRLLSDKISYKNLGLLVVDEEHKFGVADKEKIKKLKTSIDILSMSATPIPRSLNMALSQIRQISIIKTPPQGRQDINTIISKFSERVILDGCEAEFERGGQVYFVHNRVQTLVHFEKILQGLFPDKKIVITHGQLPGNMLEKRIIDFKNKKYDILLTTTVIENGIDFPNVNTIFINEAQN